MNAERDLDHARELKQLMDATVWAMSVALANGSWRVADRLVATWFDLAAPDSEGANA